MIPILKKELASRRVSLFTYCLAVYNLSWMYIALFPAIQEQAAVLSQTLESFGSALKAFGITDFGFDTLEKYLSVELFGITWPLLVITFVTARAGQAIAGETERGTIGVLLALPVRRSLIFLGKYLAGLISLIIFVSVTVFVSPLIAYMYGISYNMGSFVLLWVLCLLFSWALYSMGMFLSALYSEKGHVYLTIGGILMMMYVANIVAELQNNLSWLKYGSAFHYFSASEALISNHLSLPAVYVFGSVIVVFALAGTAWFVKRDVIV